MLDGYTCSKDGDDAGGHAEAQRRPLPLLQPAHRAHHQPTDAAHYL